MISVIIVGMFFLLLMIGNTLLIFHLRDIMLRKEQSDKQEKGQIRDELQELKSMFKGDISIILNHVKKVIK